MLPKARIDSGEFPWRDLRPAFFDGFHRSLPALADAGNHLIVEHIVETAAWMQRLLRLLAHLDVFFVGRHCPLAELERRERARGNRRIGEARTDFEVTHVLCRYDLEIETTDALDSNVQRVITAWQALERPSAYDRTQSVVLD